MVRGWRAGEAHHARAVRAAAVPGRRRAQDCQRVAAAQQRGQSHQCGTHASGCCRARLRRARATLHAKHAEPLHACRLPDWTPFGRLLHVAEPCHSSAPGRACQMYDSNTFTASHPACRKVRSSASVNAQAPTPAGRQILSSPSVGTQHPPTLHVTECTRPAPCADPPHTLRATPRTCTACTRPRCARPRCFPARSGACPTAQARYGRPRGRARRRLPRLRIHSYSGARCVLRAAVRPSPRPQSNRC